MVSNQEMIIIRADGRVRHETVVLAMDISKQAGFQKLSIATVLKQD